MSAPALPPPFALYRLAIGYYVSSALHVAARLGVADLLAGGPRTPDDLAAACGANTGALQRVMRLLVSMGIFAEEANGRFALNPLAHYLRSDVPGSMRAAVEMFGGNTRVWGELLHSVTTGEPAYARVHGMSAFEHMVAHPEQAAVFDAAMSDFTVQIGGAVAAAYDFGTLARIVDVGGGNGALLGCILAAHPALRGTVFDRPDVAVRARERLDGLGLAGRASAEGGDFFVAVPEGADAYLLKHVIHDWDDGRAADILRSCRRAMRPESRLLILEGLYPERIEASEACRGATTNDVNMLVCVGGRQRSQAEFEALFAASGFRLNRIVPTGIPTLVIEAVPA